MGYSENRAQELKARIMEITLEQRGKFFPSRCLSERLRESKFRISSSQLSQILKVYMVGEVVGDYIFAKTDDGYGWINRRDIP